MNKKILFVALSLISTATIAQSGFEGFYGQLGVGFDQNTISSSSVTFFNVDSRSVPGSSGGSFAGVVGLGYNFELNEDFLLGFGVDYGFIPSSAFNGGSITVSFTGTQTKISNRYNIFATPGYVIDKDKLAYLKAGYSSQTVKIADLTTGYGTYGETMGSGSANGYVLGLGYKQMVASGFYGFGEANYYSYSGANFAATTLSDTTAISGYSPKTNAYQFLAGVGYKF
jgi:outer membrane immunogenic protein